MSLVGPVGRLLVGLSSVGNSDHLSEVVFAKSPPRVTVPLFVIDK